MTTHDHEHRRRSSRALWVVLALTYTVVPVLPRLSAGGMIAADNTLWSGRVLDEEDDSEATRAIKAFNERRLGDTDDPRRSYADLAE